MTGPDGLDGFVALVGDELGLPVTPADARRAFDEIPGWDSMHLMTLVEVLARRTGRDIDVTDVIDAENLAGVYALTTGG